MRENAAAAAIETPVTNANTAFASTVAIASRPGIRRIRRLINANKSRAAPHLARKSPISMNSGITANT
ncbi:hypothetical protein D3C83_00600 [compost metagenome]